MIQGEGRKGTGGTLGLFPGGDRYRLKCSAGFLRDSFQQWDIFCGKWALGRIIQREAGGQLLYRLADTGLEPGLFCIRGKGQLQKRKIRVSGIRSDKALVLQVLRVGQKT